MAKAKKVNPAVEDRVAGSEEALSDFGGCGPVMAGRPLQVEIERDRLWELYVARVAKAETVNTMRRDVRAIFRDAFVEAKAAHEVWVSQTTESEVQ